MHESAQYTLEQLTVRLLITNFGFCVNDSCTDSLY